MENRFKPVSDIASAIGEPARAKIVLCLILPEWWALRSLIAFKEMQWLVDDALGHDEDYQLSPEGITVFQGLGIDIQAVRARHRRFARGCLDWSERRFHLAGALGAALLCLARKRKWVLQDLDSRILHITNLGRREILTQLGVRL